MVSNALDGWLRLVLSSQAYNQLAIFVIEFVQFVQVQFVRVGKFHSEEGTTRRRDGHHP